MQTTFPEDMQPADIESELTKLKKYTEKKVSLNINTIILRSLLIVKILNSLFIRIVYNNF